MAHSDWNNGPWVTAIRRGHLQAKSLAAILWEWNYIVFMINNGSWYFLDNLGSYLIWPILFKIIHGYMTTCFMGIFDLSFLLAVLRIWLAALGSVLTQYNVHCIGELGCTFTFSKHFLNLIQCQAHETWKRLNQI